MAVSINGSGTITGVGNIESVPASDVDFTPSGGLAATNLQSQVEFINKMVGTDGYAVPVAYASGISLTLTSQTVDYNGVIYAPLSSALPFTTSSWGADSAKFRAIQVTDADLITYNPSGTGAVTTTVQQQLRNIQSWHVNVKDAPFYAKGDGVTDDTAAIQAAIDTGALVRFPIGTYKTTSPLVIGEGKTGFCGENYLYETYGSVIDYTGSDAAVKVLDSGVNKRVLSARVENVGIKVRTANAKGLDFRHAAYSSFRNIFIRLLASGQTGVYGVGNTLGSAPYYNTFDSVMVFGQGDGVTYPNQRGYWFEGDGAGFDADGPNANIITNCGRVSGVDTAFDIHAGNGNMFSNISMEAIRSYAFKFGYTGGVAGRADGNIVNGARIEGLSTCVFAKFDGAANANTVVNYYANSISNIVFDNQSSGYSNFCKPQGIVYVASFYASDIPANTTTKLSPIYTGNEGGIYVPFSCVPYASLVTVNRFASGGAGNGVVNLYRGSTLNPNLAFTINNANRFGGRTIQQAPDRSQTYNSFDGLNGSIQCDITTDAAWDQTTADVQVQVVFLG